MTEQPLDTDDASDDDHAENERAWQALRARAETGDPQSQRDVGCAYIWGPESWSRGDLVPRDFRLAREWYVRAAEQGHLEAMSDVFLMLLSGDGGPPDLERGLRYLRFLASRRRSTGYSLDAAQFLAVFYANGDFGLPKDDVQSAYWRQRVRDHLRYQRGEKRRNKTQQKDKRYFAKANAALQKDAQRRWAAEREPSTITPREATETIENFVERKIGNTEMGRFAFQDYTNPAVEAAKAACAEVRASHPSGNIYTFCHDDGRPALLAIAARLRQT